MCSRPGRRCPRAGKLALASRTPASGSWPAPGGIRLQFRDSFRNLATLGQIPSPRTDRPMAIKGFKAMFLRYSDSRLGQFERVLRLTLHITQCGSDCIRRPDREGASGDSPDIPGDSVWLNSGYFDGNRGDIHTALEVPDS